MKTIFLFFLGVNLIASGCSTYRYRVVQPATGVPAIASQPVHIRCDPLDYTLTREHDRLAMRIDNPTDDQVMLDGNRSCVVDPHGESHPVRDHILSPHSFTRIFLPPIPFTYAYPDYFAYGPGWGWAYTYDPFWSPGWWGPPPMSYQQVLTQYDWRWETGPARIRLTYERAGKQFQHDFEFVKEKE